MNTSTRGICQFCGIKTASNISVCRVHIADIVRRAVAGDSMISIALAYSTQDRPVTRNAIIGLWHRNRPPGFQHADAATNSASTRRLRTAEREAGRAIELADKPDDLDPHDFTGCRWIDHEGGAEYGQHAAGSDWMMCQCRQASGSSYCPTHRARSIRLESTVKPIKFIPGRKFTKWATK